MGKESLVIPRFLSVVFLFFIASCSTFEMRSSQFIPPSNSSMVFPFKNETSDRFALIVGLNAEDRHRGNISLAYQVLIESGFQRQNVYIMDVNSMSPFFPKTETTSLLALRQTLKSLASFVGPEDELLIYFTGHGTRLERESYIVLNPSEVMASSELLASLDHVRPGRGLLILDQCFWGAKLKPRGCEWTTVTVAKDMVESVGTTFAREFWSSFRSGIVDVSDAFELARIRDSIVQKSGNDPHLTSRSCGIDKDLFGMIQF